jgi:hypothetical protein
VAVTHADAFVGDHGHGAGGEVVGGIVEVFEGEVELLPGRLSVDGGAFDSFRIAFLRVVVEVRVRVNERHVRNSGAL